MDGFFTALKIQTIGLALHDLGGPIALYWSCNNPKHLQKPALLNTIVYPEFSWEAAFIKACQIPGLSSILASPWGLKMVMCVGLVDSKQLTKEVLENIQSPFQDHSMVKYLAVYHVEIFTKKNYD